MPIFTKIQKLIPSYLRKWQSCLLLLLTIFTLHLTSCKKELEEPNWDIDLMAPLAKATLRVNNIINDTLKKVNPDNSISLIYQSSLYKFTLDTLFKIPDTTIAYTARLSNIDIGVINISHRTSLGDIAVKDKQDNGPTSDLYLSIMNAHNSGQPALISAIAEQNFTDAAVDASQYFQTVTLSGGFLEIKIDNHLPLDITNLIFQIRNQSNNQVLIQDTFQMIPKFTIAQKTKSLAGLTIEGHMLGNVRLSSPGSGTAMVMDTTMAMTTNIKIRDLKIQSAIASFPGQNVVDKKEKTSFKIKDIQLYRVLAKSGNINIDVYNTLHETLHFHYKMFSALKNGLPLEILGTIPPASGNVASHTVINKNLQGYDINMKGIGPVEQIYGDLDGNGLINADTVNTIYSTLTGSIDSSGNQIPLSLQDSIYFHCSFSNLAPDYVYGYLGKDTLTKSSSLDTDILHELSNASINLDDVKLSLVVNNQLGANAKVNIKQLKATNTGNNQSRSITITPSANPFSIVKPVNPNSTSVDVIPTVNILKLDKTNSDINELLNVIPNKIDFTVQIMVNQNIPVPSIGAGTDFIYYGDYISANLEVEVPMSLIASNIVMCDTTAFNFGRTNTSQITGGNLILLVDNFFPIEASPQLCLLDSTKTIIDKIAPENALILAGDVNINTGKVDKSKRSRIVISVSATRLDLLKKTKWMKITASFITRPQSQHVKIYNDYTMKFKVVGDFNYKLH